MQTGCSTQSKSGMQTRLNRYGDVAVKYSLSKALPSFSNDKMVVLTNVPDDMRVAACPNWIAKTKRYGNIFGNACSATEFPCVIDDHVELVLTLLLCRRNDDVFFVAELQQFMLPCHIDHDDTARANVQLQTGQTVDNWSPFVSWKCVTNVACLQMDVHITAGISWIVWNDALCNNSVCTLNAFRVERGCVKKSILLDMISQKISNRSHFRCDTEWMDMQAICEIGILIN